MKQLTPSQVELITLAWSELGAHILCCERIESSSGDLMNCLKNWSREELADSKDSAIHYNLLNCAAKQAYRNRADSKSTVQSIFNLIAAYRLALFLEGISCIERRSKGLYMSIDWLSIASIDRGGNNVIFDDDFSLQYQSYLGFGQENEVFERDSSIGNIQFKASKTDEKILRQADDNRTRAIAEQFQIEYTYQANKLNESESIVVTLVYNCCQYNIYNNQLLFQRIVRSIIAEDILYCTKDDCLWQVIGRSFSVDETSDWTDLSGLFSLSENPYIHLGRSTPFYIHVRRIKGEHHPSISRKGLLSDKITHCGLLDTFGSVLYYKYPQYLINLKDEGLLGTRKNLLISIDKDALLPGLFTAKSLTGSLDIESAAKTSYFAERVLSGSKMLDFSSYEIKRCPADLASIRYFAESGESWSNLSSGVVNGSFTFYNYSNIYAVWRYEPNFNSWSGRMVDSFRTMCRLFLYQGSTSVQRGELSILYISHLPDDSWIEDLRLFCYDNVVFGTAALFVPVIRYLNSNNAQFFNNTCSGMNVIQCLMELDPQESRLRFKGLINLARDDGTSINGVPGFFEKNWAFWISSSSVRILYSIEPWLSFRLKDLNNFTLENSLRSTPSIKDLLGGVPRISCNLEDLSHCYPGYNFSIGFFHIKDNQYSYSQYLFLADNESGRPICWNCKSFLCLDTAFILKMSDILNIHFRKPGVCYLSSISVREKNLIMIVNFFDVELYLMTVLIDEVISLLKPGATGYTEFHT